MMKPNKGFFALLSAAVIFSFFGVYARQLDIMFGEFAQVSLRNIIAGLIFLFIVIYRRSSFNIEKKGYVLIFSLIFPFAVLLWTFGVMQAKASNVLFMLYTGSLMSSFVIGTFMYREPLNTSKIISIIILIMGLLLISYPFVFSLGLFLGLVAGMLEGITNSLRKFLGNVRRDVLLFYQNIVGGIFVFVIGLVSGSQMVKEVSILGMFTLLMFGISLVLIGLLLMYGFNHFDVNIGTTVLSTELFFALIVNSMFLLEIPTVNEVIGGSLIFIAALLNYKS